MGIVERMKRKDQPEIDRAAVIEEQIAALRRNISERGDEAQKLSADWLHAESQAEAEEIERRRRECLRVIGRDEQRLPELQTRLAEIKAEKQRAELRWHQAEARRVYQALRAALAVAIEAQVAAMRTRDAAISALGSGVVGSYIPVAAYAGFLMPDLFKIWTDQNDRVFAPEAMTRPAQPGPAPRPVPAADLGSAMTPGPVSLRAKPAIQPAPPRPAPPVLTKPREPDDTAPLQPNEVRVKALFSNWSPADDRPTTHAGQIIRMPREAAKQALARGLIELVDEAIDAAAASTGTPA